nr:hypothetical protein [Tanacetum cinerariifolium]
VNQNIVNEYDHKLIKIWLAHLIHLIQENYWCVGQTKRYYLELVMTYRVLIVVLGISSSQTLKLADMVHVLLVLRQALGRSEIPLVWLEEFFKYLISFLHVLLGLYARYDTQSRSASIAFDYQYFIVVGNTNNLVITHDNHETESQSDNTIDSPHGFVIHGIEVLKGNKKVTKVIDVKN